MQSQIFSFEMLLSYLLVASYVVVPAAGAVALMVIEPMLRRVKEDGFGIRETCTFVSLLGAFCGLLYEEQIFLPGKTAFQGALYIDTFTFFVSAIILVTALLSALVSFARMHLEGIDARGEWYSLLLFATTGALLYSSAAEFITMFLGLEIMSMAVYAMCSSSIAYRGAPMKRSAEAGLKYFLLGSFSSAFFLFGIALTYGLTGSLSISAVSESIGGTRALSIGFILVGTLFKVGAVPFHFWVPDTYQGAPTTVTSFMSSVVKIAGFAGIIRIFTVAFKGEIVFWSGAVWVVAVITMIAGNLFALRQRSVKRMLAYSSIAHAGYLLVGLLSVGGSFGGSAAILYYLVVYALVSLGAFGVVLAVCAEHTQSQHPDDIARFNGLGKRRPFVAACMALFMLSLAGLPPGLGGFMGKMYLFSAAIHAEYLGIVIIGVLASALSCYYYLRIIVAMYFISSEGEREDYMPLGASLGIALLLCAFGAILVGIFPDVIYDAAQIAAQSL